MRTGWNLIQFEPEISNDRRENLTKREKKSLKFRYSEKAPNFSEISTVDLSYVVTVKSTVEILQNFVAFSEYTNF